LSVDPRSVLADPFGIVTGAAPALPALPVDPLAVLADPVGTVTGAAPALPALPALPVDPLAVLADPVGTVTGGGCIASSPVSQAPRDPSPAPHRGRRSRG
jgi:hypothetical protein